MIAQRIDRTLCSALLLLLGLLTTDLVAADLAFHPLFTDHMVLQRDMPVAVYGQAESGEQITVAFADQRNSVRADANGRWLVTLDPMPANAEPSAMTVRGTTNDGQLSLSDILVGDVWLCGGQSNMDRSLSAYSLLTDTVADVHEPLIRLLDIEVATSHSELDVPGISHAFSDSWQVCEGAPLQAFSATGYYFGLTLHQELGVPIGLIESSRGATRIEPWIPSPCLARIGESVEVIREKDGTVSWQSPSSLYNGMIYPLKDFTFKGVIWYQGESNSRWPIKYVELFPAMIEGWREAFGRNVPFYFAQLASHVPPSWAVEGEPWAWLREAQTKALRLPNTAMAVTIDLGEYEDIHPQNKRPVGERLARASLKDAGQNVLISGPTFQKMTLEGGKCYINLGDVGSGLETRRVAMNNRPGLPFGEDPEAFIAEADTLEGFTVCGPSRQFVKAQAEIVDNTVVVWSDEVKQPVAVRYGWAGFAVCNLYNSEGLPTVPFRTDSFPPPNFLGELVGEPFDGDASGLGEAMTLGRSPMPIDRQEIDSVAAVVFGPNSSGRSQAFYREPNEVFRNGNRQNVVLTLVYFDDGTESITLQYDSADEEFQFGNFPPGAWKTGGVLRLTNTRSWRCIHFPIPDAGFSGRCNGSDLRLQTDGPLVLGGMYARGGR